MRLTSMIVWFRLCLKQFACAPQQQRHSKTVLSSLSIHAARRSARAAIVRQFYLFFFVNLIQFPPTRLLSHVYKQIILPNILRYRCCVLLSEQEKKLLFYSLANFCVLHFVSILFCTYNEKKKLYSQ